MKSEQPSSTFPDPPREVRVVRAVLSTDANDALRTKHAIDAAGWPQPRAYVADLIRQGVIAGEIDEDAGRGVLNVNVRDVLSAGVESCANWLSTELSLDSKSLLLSPDRPPSRTRGEELMWEELAAFGLAIRSETHYALSPMGVRLSASLSRQIENTGSTIVMGDVNGSQIASGGASIRNSAIVNATEPDSQAIEALHSVVVALIRKLSEPSAVTPPELMSDLETIRVQCESTKPRREVIAACLREAHTILDGVVASGVYVALAELVTRLHL